MKVFLILLLSTLMLTASPMAIAAESAVSEMATIIIELNHYPTAEDKKVLTHIINDPHATAGEKVIAAALMRMQHRVNDEDADKLRRLAADDSVAEAERELAEIFLTIAHHPTKTDIKRLKAVAE
jgi:hypothetical protein